MHLPVKTQTYLDMFVGSIAANSRNRKEAMERVDEELNHRFNYIINSEGIEEGSYLMDRLKNFEMPYIKEYAKKHINRCMVA